MPIREGMTYIIALIRQFGHVGIDDMTLGDVTYWSDQQLQDIADRHLYSTLIPLTPTQLVTRTVYKLNAPRHYYGENDTYVDDVLTTQKLWVYDHNQTGVNTTFIYEPYTQEVTFASGLNEDYKYYIEGRFINLYDALAELWGLKAAQRFDYISFKGGDNKMDMDQEYNHCKQQEQHYRNLIARRIPRTRSNKWSIS